MNQYKDKVRGFTEEVWNKKNFHVFEKIIHPDFQYNDPVYPNVNSKNEYKAFNPHKIAPIDKILRETIEI